MSLATAFRYDRGDQVREAALRIERAAEALASAARRIRIAMERPVYDLAVEAARLDDLQGEVGRAIGDLISVHERARLPVDLPAWLTLAFDQDADGAELLAELVAIGLADGEITVAETADRLELSRRALSRRTRQAGLPTPTRILAFSSLMGALQLYGAFDVTLREAAAISGWDPFGLSNRVKALTGLRPGAWKKNGADLQMLCERFAEEDGQA